MPELLQYLSDRFFSIKNKGSKEGWNDEVEKFILKEVLKEGVQFFYEKKLKAMLSKEAKATSTEHVLVANPSQWNTMFENIPLTNFDEQHMKSLMSDVSLVISKFIPSDVVEKVKSELNHLERDSKFERGYVNHRLTKEKFMDFSLGMIKKEDFPGCVLLV